MQKQCGRCRHLFQCQSDDIENCQCNKVKLTDETVAFLGKTYFDCLCQACLLHLNAQTSAVKDLTFPTRSDMFVEGVHFYKEGNNWVFTELYHMLRGHCCGNSCRHCVYGF
ncbi:cysteine-rich CWC family protein [Dyadobacter psychrotolerans]|uniref:Cysteine-rich CWC family protein n=1 Tax=Dyadobacter psychrotolerans TaxID=2541721 RepID=A0A4R5DKS0_9BACT|nr:cysteine-rich CWC family protein [Dyadobacter psychrotolerans]TDE14659.1 hypothetical protein E0F88_15840 [Dyadobacter psychrotolerans]